MLLDDCPSSGCSPGISVKEYDKIHEGEFQVTEDEQTLVCDKHSQVGDKFFDLISLASRTVLHMQYMLN